MNTSYKDYIVVIGLLAVLLALILWTRPGKPAQAVCPPQTVCPAQNTLVASAPVTQPGIRDAFNPEGKDAYAAGQDESGAADTAVTAVTAAAASDTNTQTQAAAVQRQPRKIQRVVTTSVTTDYGSEADTSEAVVPAVAATTAAAATVAAAPAVSAEVSAPSAAVTTTTAATTASSAASAPDYLMYNGKRVVVSGGKVSLVGNDGSEEVLFNHLRCVSECSYVVNDTLHCKDAVGRVVDLNLSTRKVTQYKYTKSQLCVSCQNK